MCLIRVRAKLCRRGPDLRMPVVQEVNCFVTKNCQNIICVQKTQTQTGLEQVKVNDDNLNFWVNYSFKNRYDRIF